MKEVTSTPFLRRGDGRTEVLRPLLGAETVSEGAEPGHLAADGHLGGIALAAAARERPLRVGLEDVVVAGRRLVVETAHGAEEAHLVVVHDVLEEHRGDECVDGVPAAPEHLQRGFGDDGELSTHHHRVADGLLFRSLVVERVPRVRPYIGGQVLAGCRQRCQRERQQTDPSTKNLCTSHAASSGGRRWESPPPQSVRYINSRRRRRDASGRSTRGACRRPPSRRSAWSRCASCRRRDR